VVLNILSLEVAMTSWDLRCRLLSSWPDETPSQWEITSPTGVGGVVVGNTVIDQDLKGWIYLSARNHPNTRCASDLLEEPSGDSLRNSNSLRLCDYLGPEGLRPQV